MLKVDLVTNPCSRRDNSEIIKGRLAPFQEVITFHITLIFARDIFRFCAGRSEIIHHDGMVDNQMDRVERINRFGRTAELNDSVAHRGEVDHGWNAGEILHQHTGWAVGDFMGRRLWAQPICDRLDVFFFDRVSVFMAQ